MIPLGDRRSIHWMRAAPYGGLVEAVLQERRSFQLPAISLLALGVTGLAS